MSRFDYTTLPAESIKAAYLARLAQEGCSPLTVLVEIGDAARAMPVTTDTRDALMERMAKKLDAIAQWLEKTPGEMPGWPGDDLIGGILLDYAAALRTPRPESDARDAARMQAIAAHPGWLRYLSSGNRKGKWAFHAPVTNYEYDVFDTPQAAIDAALTQPEAK